MAGMIVFFACCWVIRIMNDQSPLSTLWLEWIVDHLIYPLKIFTFLVIVLYVLARAYLVVECFISLSYLPADAYQIPSWSVYVPHFS